MKKMTFTKMVASGNDFVVIDCIDKGCRPQAACCKFNELAMRICDRKFGVGADGLLILEKSRAADIRMRIFNADGSEAEMCGNGARCVARYIGKPKVKIETQAGIIEAKADRDNVKIKLTDPKDLKLDIPVQINQRDIHLNFINTGVPHVVIFVEGLEKIDAAGLGREIRNLQNFAPKGTNVNFVEIVNSDYIKIRTYERGVEDETLACGTGSVAAALIFVLKTGAADKIKVQTKSREVLTVSFRRLRNDFNNVWLEGKVRIVYKGEYNV